MIKKGELYYPSKEFQKKAHINKKEIYKKAEKDPVKFWEKLAKELFWFKKWEKGFWHQPPYFQWFVGGKINITSNIFDPPKFLLRKKLRRARKNKIAIIWEPEPITENSVFLTYNELFKQVNKFANALKKLGVKKGNKVGIYLPMIPEAIISMLACARIGAVHCVVFSAFSPNALQIRLRVSEAKILITADGYFRRGKTISLKQNSDQGIKETRIEKVIVVKRTGNEIPWDEKKDFWWHDLIKEEKEECEPEIMDSEDPLFILPESGTAGQFLPILHTTAGYTVQSYQTGKWVFDFKENDIFWCTADIGWITGHTYGVYSPLLNGVTIVMFEGAPDWPAPDRWAQIIEKHKVSIFYTAPTAIRMFEKYGEELLKKYEFKTLRLLGSVGEPIDEAAWFWYFKNIGREKCPIVDTWWQTETGGILITSLPGLGPFKPSFAGLPLPSVKIDILKEDGSSCQTNETGNLVILPPFSPGFLRGVYNNQKAYEQIYWSKQDDKIYLTSDGALKDENGLIKVVGRVDDAIKIAGHRITTTEIENVINNLLEITDCAVIGVPDDIKGEVPIAFVIAPKLTISIEELEKVIVAQIRKEIGPIAALKKVYLTEDLPKTRSGKTMRLLLKKLWAGEELGNISALANPEVLEKIKSLINK